MFRLAAALIAVASSLTAFAAPETYVFDTVHTFPQFTVDHLGFSTVYGRFDKSSGKFTLDKAAKAASLEITIQTASISTGHPTDKGAYSRTRDDHLRSADFFNVAEFPTMTYKSTGVKFNGDNLASVEGNLTLLGVTKPVALQLDRWKCGQNPFSKKEMCGGNASGTIKRSDFGMKFGVPAIGDELKLMIVFEAYRE